MSCPCCDQTHCNCEIDDEGKKAFEEAFNTLWRVSFQLVQTNENLTATQNRCTELLLENRKLKKQIAYLESRESHYSGLSILLVQAKEHAEK